MKKLIYLLIACTVLWSGCTEDALQTEDIKSSNEVTGKITSRVVSSEQAKAFAEKAIGAIQEKGDTVVIKNSVLRSVEKVQSVKSSDGTTVLYIVNFTDEQGFMVLSADKEAQNPMLSFDTKRNFELEKIEEGSTVWAWLEAEKLKISENLKSGIHADNQGYQLWEYIIANEVKDENGEVSTIEVTVEIANIDEANNSKGAQLRATHPNKRGWYTISPWYNVSRNLWGQGPGYSANAPSPNNHLVGCPAVAIGLLCKTWSYPSGYNYSAMPTTLNTKASNAISQMFRDIANKIPNYTWGTSSSGATPSNILIGLKNVGYTQAKMMNYDFTTAYNSIRDWYPVLLGAYQGSWGGGHIWIADGYYEQTWKYTRTKKILGITISTKTWYEYMDTFYMNWGWNGTGNGWVDQENWNSGSNGSFNYSRKLYYDLYPY
jgi:hypothetical protein